MDFHSRSFSRAALGDLVELLSSNARSRWPAPIQLMPGDLVWQLPGSAPKENLQLWYQADRLIGFAWLQPPSTLQFDVSAATTGQSELVDRILNWASERQLAFATGYPFYLDLQSMTEWAEAIRTLPARPSDRRRFLVTSVMERDATGVARLLQHGFTATAHCNPHLARSLDPIQPLTLPEGITVRAVERDEFASRVAIHRAAWAPSTGFSLERYLQVRAFSNIFDPELDLVAVDKAGNFLSCCICWADSGSGIGFIEPFGTHPDARGQGISQAMVRAGLHRLKDRGMTRARIYTAGFNHQAIRLYEACGFRLRDREITYLKQL
jgi:ribosomal protein S18 acetylase RimI-like enzyme